MSAARPGEVQTMDLPQPPMQYPSRTTKHPRVTAAIPAFNEEETIGRVIEETKKYVDDVVVIDDGSTDRTSEIALKGGATVLRHSDNYGYGAALATGLSHVKANGSDVLVTLDGDGQHEPAEIPRLVRPILDGEADFVTGSRFLKIPEGSRIPRYRKMGIGIVNEIWRISSGHALTDTQCGFRAYSRNAMAKMSIRQANMSASLEILDNAQRERLRIAEVPVTVRYGLGTSSAGAGRHGLELVNYVLRKVREEHPLIIFGGLGIVLAAMSLLFGVHSLLSYLEYGGLPLGPVILAITLFFAGILMIFGGLILSAIQALGQKLNGRST